MSKLGYQFESEIENFFLDFEGLNKQTPLLGFDGTGNLLFKRTFRVPNSGAMQSIKGDIITALPWLSRQMKVECKSRYDSTKKDGPIINIDKSWITKNEQEARADHQIPALVFSIKKVKTHRIWWVMHSDDFLNLRGTFLSCFYTMHRAEKEKQSNYIKFIHRSLLKTEEDSILTFHDPKLREGLYYVLSHETFSRKLRGIKDKWQS